MCGIKLENTVCYQNATDTIIFYPSCPEVGSQGECIGRITGNCKCNPTSECVTGNQHCLEECGCNVGYRECENGKWVARPVSRKNII